MPMAAATPIAGAPRMTIVRMASATSSHRVQVTYSCTSGSLLWSIITTLPSSHSMVLTSPHSQNSRGRPFPSQRLFHKYRAACYLKQFLTTQRVRQSVGYPIQHTVAFPPNVVYPTSRRQHIINMALYSHHLSFCGDRSVNERGFHDSPVPIPTTQLVDHLKRRFRPGRSLYLIHAVVLVTVPLRQICRRHENKTHAVHQGLPKSAMRDTGNRKRHPEFIRNLRIHTKNQSNTRTT